MSSSPFPNKTPVGKPKKEFCYEQLNCMLEQNHDFDALLTSYEKYNKTISNFYLNNNSNGDIKIPRKTFTERRKQEIREHYLLTENFAETAKAFPLNESTGRSIVKSTICDVKLSDKGNHSGAGRPLMYPKDEENKFVAWILQLLDLQISVSVLSLQEKAKKVIRPHNPTVSASKGWVEKFISRHRLSIRNRTSVSQKLPQQLDGYLTKFYEDAGRYMSIVNTRVHL